MLYLTNLRKKVPSLIELSKIFIVLLMSGWVVFVPLLDIVHELENHSWNKNLDAGFCKSDCNASEHKYSHLNHGCCHVRIRDSFTVASQDRAFFEIVQSVETELFHYEYTDEFFVLYSSRAPLIT